MTTIKENQKGFLFKNGKFHKLLGAGNYHTFGNSSIEIVSISQPLHSCNCPLEVLLKQKDIRNQVETIEVKDEQLALHFINDRFTACLPTGNYAFWNTIDTHSFTIVDITHPKVEETLPRYIFSMIPDTFYQKIEIAEYEKGRLFYDQHMERILEEGTYYFWNTKTKVHVEIMDMRTKQLNINGQEILTKDKVTLRINMITRYRITDCIRIACEIEDYMEQLYTMIQLALRETIGALRMDELLENKEAISIKIFEALKQKGEAIYIEILEAGIKDIILPGDMRDIMNTVLIAEKRAQANVITRREEVASTRSLLNTAKLMEENKTLYRLKELEFLEKICENVGTINLNGSKDIVTQLASFITRQEE